MKWVILFFIIVLVIVLFGGRLDNSGASPTPTISATSAPTGTATTGPPPTVDTASPNIFYFLNMAIEDMERSTKFNQLEHINGASYQVVYVGFRPENGVPAILQVNARCECANNAQCCSPTHTFVITMQAMDDVYYEPLILNQVPSTVTKMEVQCFDHASPSGTMSVPWADVLTFLQGNLDGFQLWYKVTPVPVP